MIVRSVYLYYGEYGGMWKSRENLWHQGISVSTTCSAPEG